jgi:cellulose synthase/poly-beta-1,6-N-acetylglucosamine synthase-like glycosyltransferase
LPRRCLPDAELPHVVVQIPSFNEGGVLRRGIEAAAALDWPRDKLHIQVLDDSTDETASWRARWWPSCARRGIDVVALQRTDRSGFKGGALHEAMQQTPARLLRHLRRRLRAAGGFPAVCMRPFFANPQLGLRAGALRLSQSARERADRNADGHARCPSRHRAGDALLGRHPLPFNGTCGIWQRAAIEAGGGWKGDTVTEDLDLTYRGWVKGWRACSDQRARCRASCPPTPRPGCASSSAGRTASAMSRCAWFPEILQSRDITPVGQGAAASASLHGAEPARSC